MKIDPQEILLVCENAPSMAEAHRRLGKLRFSTFAKYAKELGCWSPNQGGKGDPANTYRGAMFYIENNVGITSHKLKEKLIKDRY
jgi:hypothetical protein